MGVFDSFFGGGSKITLPTIDTNQLIQDQLKYARPNQYGPQGSLTYGGDGSITVAESPWLKQFREGQQTTAQQLGQHLAGNVDTLPSVPTSLDWSKVDPILGQDAFSADADKVSNATFANAMALLRPEWDARDRASRENLVQSGNPLGNERYSIESSRLDQARRGAETAAANDAVLAGRAEQSRLLGLAQANRGEQTQRQLSDIGLASAGREQGLGELGSYLSGGFTPQSTVSAGDFFAPGNVDTMGPAMLANQNATQQALLNAQRQNAGLGGLVSLGSSLIKAAPFFMS